MIFDRLDRSALYHPLHVRFAQAFEFLRTVTPATPVGRIELAGEELFVLIQEYEPKLAAEKSFEAHRRYLDIQLILSGSELMGCGPLSSADRSSAAFNEEKDYAHYARLDAPVTWLAAGEGQFAIFFPDDAHMPGVRPPDVPPRGVRKAVVQVRA